VSVNNIAVSLMARVAAGCALAAAAIWLMVWLHQYRSHGRTSVNDMRLVLDLTWMDAAKVLPFAFVLLLPGLEVVVRRARADHRREDRVRAALVLGRAAQGCVILGAVAGAADFWSFPFGSYEETFESRGGNEVPYQFVGSVMTGVVVAILAVARRTAGDGEWVALLVLASGALTSSLWTPVLLWPAIAWAFFGAWLWWSASRYARKTPAPT
jgi:hypothetical protein